jgi:hypothetical protein
MIAVKNESRILYLVAVHGTFFAFGATAIGALIYLSFVGGIIAFVGLILAERYKLAVLIEVLIWTALLWGAMTIISGPRFRHISIPRQRYTLTAAFAAGGMIPWAFLVLFVRTSGIMLGWKTIVLFITEPAIAYAFATVCHALSKRRFPVH